MSKNALMLRPEDQLILLTLLAQHLPQVSAWAYGSRVNGTAHAASDLDLVLRSPDLSRIPLSALHDFIDALQQSSIPILVEARDWATLPEYFHQEILKSYIELVTAHD